jgi:hypothetical protein
MSENLQPYEDARKTIKYMFGEDAAQFAMIMTQMFQATEMFVHLLNLVYDHSDMTEEQFTEELDAYLAINAATSEGVAQVMGVSPEQANEVFDIVSNAHQIVLAKNEQVGKEMH